MVHLLVAYSLESCWLKACLFEARSFLVPLLEVTSLMGAHSLMTPHHRILHSCAWTIESVVDLVTSTKRGIHQQADE